MNNLDELSRSNASVVQSGDGYELLSPDGEVIAWMLDRNGRCRFYWRWRFRPNEFLL